MGILLYMRNHMAYAALLIIAIFFAYLHFSKQNNVESSALAQSYNEIIVPSGSRTHFVLSDGTKVTLNACSKLRYNYNYGAENRIVELEGEAYFVVSKNENLPFIVKTPLVSVKALGTEFNVKTYPGDKTVETTLVKGSIEVEVKDKSIEERIILKPDQKLTLNYEENTVVSKVTSTGQRTNNTIRAKDLKIITKRKDISPANVDVIPIVSWKDSRWIIEDETLADLAVELERRYDIKIEIKSEKLKSCRFSGTLLDEPLEQVLKVIGMTAPVKYEFQGKQVIFKAAFSNK